MFHLLRQRRSKKAAKKRQDSQVKPLDTDEADKDPAYLAKRRVWKLVSGVAVCGFHTWRVRNAAGVAGRSGSVASDRGNAWLVRALLGGKFARHRGSQNLYYLSHPAP